MICMHGSPTGSQDCALCRHQVLVQHGQKQPRRQYDYGSPDPDVLTRGVARVRAALERNGRPAHGSPSRWEPQASPSTRSVVITQPALDLEDQP